MRLIDADALKRKVQKIATDSWKMKIMASVETVLNQFIDYIEQSPTVGGWISVKDRPPEKDQDVIIYGSWTGVTGTVYEETRLISMDEAIYEGFTPIAWMPKPKPPKERKEGETG